MERGIDGGKDRKTERRERELGTVQRLSNITVCKLRPSIRQKTIVYYRLAMARLIEGAGHK